MASVYGLHHVLSVVSDMTRAVEFYVEVLGMRVLSGAVNLDETSVLQVYCGDSLGSPGSIISLQSCPDAETGRRGIGQISNVAFSIGKDAHDFWVRRLSKLGIKIEGSAWSFQERHLCFHDPDGMSLSLVADDMASITPDDGSPVVAVGEIRSIELQVEKIEPTSRLLSDILGYDEIAREGPVTRFRSRTNQRTTIDVLTASNYRSGAGGWGVPRHVAWRVPDLKTLVQVRAQIVEMGYDVSPPFDREFFQACYFIGPDGMQFAIATDGPGFPTPAARRISGPT